MVIEISAAEPPVSHSTDCQLCMRNAEPPVSHSTDCQLCMRKLTFCICENKDADQLRRSAPLFSQPG